MAQLYAVREPLRCWADGVAGSTCSALISDHVRTSSARLLETFCDWILCLQLMALPDQMAAPPHSSYSKLTCGCIRALGSQIPAARYGHQVGAATLCSRVF